MSKISLSNICVYCGSSPGRVADYIDNAKTLAKALVNQNIGLVYGGANVGIMGALADEVLLLGGRVTGIIPEALVGKEVAHKNLTELRVTKSMHERKSIMAELSDAFVAMPGGIGTLEEIFEMWTWAQLGFHTKPCALLNINGYYDKLCDFLDHSVGEEFVKPIQRNMLIVEANPQILLERLLNYVAPVVDKWIGRKEKL